MKEFSAKLRSPHSSQHGSMLSMASLNTSETASTSGLDAILSDSPVDDATQLIMVIKGCRKYLALDEQEYESAFKSYCTMTHFSLLKIAANQYMTLAFSFTNLYLRVLAFGIQEKNRRTTDESRVC